jgi:hypothetical protein
MTNSFVQQDCCGHESCAIMSTHLLVRQSTTLTFSTLDPSVAASPFAAEVKQEVSRGSCLSTVASSFGIIASVY